MTAFLSLLLPAYGSGTLAPLRSWMQITVLFTAAAIALGMLIAARSVALRQRPLTNALLALVGLTFSSL